MIYLLIAILFVLVSGLCILVLKYRSDVSFLKDMFKINNDYVKENAQHWDHAIELCERVCKLNGEMLESMDARDRVIERLKNGEGA